MRDRMDMCRLYFPVKAPDPVAPPRGLGEVRRMLRAVSRLVMPFAFAALVLPAGVAPSFGAPAAEQQGLPRFASLSAGKVYLREGPAYGTRVLWVYHRKRLPVKVLVEYDVWRRVQMPDGAIGWLHTAMLSRVRTVVVTGTAMAPIRSDADPASKTLALAQPGVIAKLETCRATACEISASGTEGWIDKKTIWGVGAGETFR